MKGQRKSPKVKKADLLNMRLTKEIDALETTVASLRATVDRQGLILDFVYSELQAKGILPNVTPAATGVRVKMVPSPGVINKEILAAPVPIALKQQPRDISKLK